MATDIKKLVEAAKAAAEAAKEAQARQEASESEATSAATTRAMTALDQANAALFEAAGRSVTDDGEVVAGWGAELRVTGKVSTISDAVAARLRQGDVDATARMTDAEVLAADRRRAALQEQEARDGLVRDAGKDPASIDDETRRRIERNETLKQLGHEDLTKSRVIGVDPTDLTDDDIRDAAEEKGARAFVGAHTDKDPSQVTQRDIFDFKNKADDAFADAILGPNADPVDKMKLLGDQRSRQPGGPGVNANQDDGKPGQPSGPAIPAAPTDLGGDWAPDTAPAERPNNSGNDTPAQPAEPAPKEDDGPELVGVIGYSVYNEETGEYERTTVEIYQDENGNYVDKDGNPLPQEVIDQIPEEEDDDDADPPPAEDTDDDDDDEDTDSDTEYTPAPDGDPIITDPSKLQEFLATDPRTKGDPWVENPSPEASGGGGGNGRTGPVGGGVKDPPKGGEAVGGTFVDPGRPPGARPGAVDPGDHGDNGPMVMGAEDDPMDSDAIPEGAAAHLAPGGGTGTAGVAGSGKAALDADFGTGAPARSVAPAPASKAGGVDDDAQEDDGGSSLAARLATVDLAELDTDDEPFSAARAGRMSALDDDDPDVEQD